ncbi:MAG: hypothetical protein IJX62_09775 [Clostridia bacterium]|nr:hypothetical protein [Clostridia bacterium]
MKKFIRMIALSLVLVMSVVMLASCGAPNSDPDKALEALKENEYVAVKSEALAVAGLALAGIKNVDCVVSGSATIDDKFETVTILYFTSKDAANDAWEKAQKYADDEKDSKAEDWVCKKSGAMIYFGTPNGVKAAK